MQWITAGAVSSVNGGTFLVSPLEWIGLIGWFSRFQRKIYRNCIDSVICISKTGPVNGPFETEMLSNHCYLETALISPESESKTVREIWLEVTLWNKFTTPQEKWLRPWSPGICFQKLCFSVSYLWIETTWLFLQMRRGWIRAQWHPVSDPA